MSLNPLDYNIGLLGEAGIGKTTTIKEAVEIMLAEQGLEDTSEGYLFLETGHEDGADAIEGINYVNVPTWAQQYDEDTNSIGFSTLVNDIIENKDTDYPDLKVVIVDTYDQLRKIAEAEVIRIHNRTHEKKVQTIKAALGGYMAGDDKADEIVIDALWNLKSVGVSFIVIGHTKMKASEDVMSEEKFSQLTTDMSTRSFNQIKNKLHILGIAYLDRTFEGKGKDDKKKIKSESRVICFRDDNYGIDSKSRFAEIAPYIPLDAQTFVDTLKDAIRKGAGKSGDSDKKLEARQKEKDEIKKRAVTKAKTEHVNKEKNEELINVMVSKFKDIDDAELKGSIVNALRKIDPDAKNFDILADAPTVKVEEVYKLFN